jgi:hypothetical protein
VDRSIDVLVSEIAEQHHGLFATHHLVQLGVASHERAYRLKAGRWVLEYEGVYRFAGTPLTWRGRLLAACWAGGLRAAASGRAAAELWRFPGGSDAHLEITCPRWRRSRHDGLIVHESLAFDEIDTTTADGIPVTTVPRTLFDLARVCGDGTLDLAIDNALRRHLTTIADLEATRDRLARSGRPGSARFRSVLLGRAPGVTESHAERRLLQLLERHGLPRPVVQYEIRDANGRLVARVDLAYPDLRIAIEYDSYAHHMGTEAHDRDGSRRNDIVASGWHPVTATAADLRNGGYRLAAAVRQARALRSCVSTGE